MRVICIDNEGYTFPSAKFTIGKVYDDAVDLDDVHLPNNYLITDDVKEKVIARKDSFCTIEEYRNITIDKIL